MKWKNNPNCACLQASAAK